MNRYLIKRFILIIPTLVAISIFAFLISKAVPQDPVISILTLSGAGDDIDPNEYNKVYTNLGLQKPTFYFSIKPNNYPRNINQISDYNSKRLLMRLLKLGMDGNDAIRLATSNEKNDLVILEPNELRSQISLLFPLQRLYYPKLHWHGFDNQYHQWFVSFMKGDLGQSLVYRKDVFQVVKKALIWTFHIAVGAILYAFFWGLLIGYFLALRPEGKKERMVGQLLYLLYSIPVFWLATMLVMYFTTDDYGSWTNIFPSVGIDIYPELSTWAQVRMNIHKLFLPIIAGSFTSIAYISRILRRSILDEMEAPYIMTAYSKGLSHKDVVKKQALPNSLLPIITILAGSIPATIGGSVVIEVIFNISGIGRLLYDSIEMADWNVVFCIIMLIGIITIISYLISDLLYAYLNPKIRYA